MKILVTGGSGYIGSHTILDLIQNGHTVVCVDNCMRSRADTIERLEKYANTQIDHYRTDMTDQDALHNVFDLNPDIDHVIHFAAVKAVGESVANPLLYYHNNLVSLLNLLECCKTAPTLKRIVFSSSCTVYGTPDAIPVTETTPQKPAESPYGATKQMAERILTDYSAATPGQQICLLRYFNPGGAHPSAVIGEDLIPGLPAANLIPLIVNTAAGLRAKPLQIYGTDYHTRDGTCIRDFIHVCDIATAHRLAIEYEQREHVNIFNLGAGHDITVLEAISAFERVTGVSVPRESVERRSGDVAAIYADNKKAREQLGWTLEYTLDDIMRTAWKYYQINCNPTIGE
jgi:UDP-glucose 4-epimerase